MTKPALGVFPCLVGLPRAYSSGSAGVTAECGKHRRQRHRNEYTLIIIMGWDEIQLVLCVPGMHEAIGVVVHACDLSTGDRDRKVRKSRSSSAMQR